MTFAFFFRTLKKHPEKKKRLTFPTFFVFLINSFYLFEQFWDYRKMKQEV